MSIAENSSPEWTGNIWIPSENRWLRPDTMARKMGVTVRTIRNMVQRGQLERRREKGKVWVRINNFDDEVASPKAEPKGVQALRSIPKEQDQAPVQTEPKQIHDHPQNTQIPATFLEMFKEMQQELKSLREETVNLKSELLNSQMEKQRVDLQLSTMERTVNEQERKAGFQKDEIRKMKAQISAEKEAFECLQTAFELGWFNRKLKFDLVHRANALRKALPSS